eukprot:CAMPEP_0182462832 /NCGR_PEP_ID=MMETSP1319-20130603/6960_1 /TAXON_ID=172717 /ORGANISM="Bolidomonas pacifica, Strain RCC208" /LENGTH=88 /DNA_ID=CAMNT_0024662299 /DNA_START=9 /DNA_END=272 /DNA_ORIENTATION=-
MYKIVCFVAAVAGTFQGVQSFGSVDEAVKLCVEGLQEDVWMAGDCSILAACGESFDLISSGGAECDYTVCEFHLDDVCYMTDVAHLGD